MAKKSLQKQLEERAAVAAQQAAPATEETPQAAKETKKQAPKPPNVLATFFGAPVFRLPESQGEFKDEKTGKITRRMAYVSFPHFLDGNLAFETSIYAEEATVRGSDGAQYLEMVFKMTMPRQITALKDDPQSLSRFNDWKNEVLHSYEEWAENNEQEVPQKAPRQQQLVPRLVKRVKIGAATQQEA